MVSEGRRGRVTPEFRIERVSIEVTNKCGKGCSFCYNQSHRAGHTDWTPDELIAFCRSCAAGGVQAVSFGGGEPLEYPGIDRVIAGLRGVMFRSMTTNGLLLDDGAIAMLAEAGVDKVHVSIHFPGNRSEVDRVIRQVGELADAGIRSGVNLLVASGSVDDAARCAGELRDAGIDASRVVYLPMRGERTPTVAEMGKVAGGERFQSMSCLGGCASSPRFCSVSWDKRVGWCSYTVSRRMVEPLTHAALVSALTGLELETC